MTRSERVDSWKKRVRELPKQHPDELLFEFYRLHGVSMTETDSDSQFPSAFEFCRTPHQRATKDNLAEVCATAYGGGVFIALEVGESLEGFPRSYWLVGIFSDDMKFAQPIFPGEEQLNKLRPKDIVLPNYGGKDETWFWQRGNEVNWLATEFLPKAPKLNLETIKKIQEKNEIWIELNKPVSEGRPGESLFLFLRVNDGWMIEPNPRDSFDLDPCTPLLRWATPRTLAKACVRYGGGSFVAVEISESRDGHALSYWVIRVKDRDHHVSKQVVFDDEKLIAMRQPLDGLQLNTWQSLDQRKPFDQAPDRRYAYFGQWLTEAAFAAHSLSQLPNFETKRQKRKTIARKITTGPQRQAYVTRAGELWESGDSLAEIAKVMRQEFWPEHNDEMLETCTKSAIASYGKRGQRAKQKAKKKKKLLP